MATNQQTRRRGRASDARRAPNPALRAARRDDRPRTAAPCAHFPRCVGCPLVAIDYREQLATKDATLRAALAAEPALAGAAIELPCASPQAFGYRNQAKLVFRSRYVPPHGREVLLGVYRPGTHSVAPAERCAVHHRHLQPLLASLRHEVERLEIPIYDERVRSGALRYALLRTATARPDVHLTLVSAVPDLPRLDELLRRLRRTHPELAATFLCVNSTPGNTILSSDIRALHGPPALVESFGEIALESRPDAFLQANTAVATRIYATARDWLAPAAGDVAVDLYCGVGALALHLAPHVARVLGVEAQPSAVACAIANARRLGAGNAEFVVGTVEDAPRLLAERQLGDVTIATVNPPRKGLSAAARDALAAIGAERIAYVSCDPSTLARDLAVLVQRGYRLERVQAFDMLPQTPHVEALALLSRRA